LERSENLTLNGQGTTGKLLSQILTSNENVAIQMRQIEKGDIPMHSQILTSSNINSAKISNTQATMISQSLTPSKIDTAKLSQTAPKQIIHFNRTESSNRNQRFRPK
jgi:microcystin-dependent protein